jgi:hypothetical protein
MAVVAGHGVTHMGGSTVQFAAVNLVADRLGIEFGRFHVLIHMASPAIGVNRVQEIYVAIVSISCQLHFSFGRRLA